MNMHYIISITDGDYFYNLLYLVASLASFFIFLTVGLKRKYPLHDWLLISLSALVTMTIGMHIATFSFSDWLHFLSAENTELIGGKTSLGALVGFLLGIWIAQKALKSHYPVLDIYAFIFPVVLIIQRAGCLIAGCCFGVPTNGIVGVQYADHYPIFQHHFQEGLLAGNSEVSLAVHPVPVYFMLASMITLLLIFRFRNNLRRRGSLFLLSILMIGSIRIIIEFFRDPITNHQIGEIWMGLKMVQWLLTLMVITAGVILILRERSEAISCQAANNNSLAPHLIISSILAVLVIPFSGVFDQSELINLFIHFTLFGGVMLVVIIKIKKQLILRLSPLILVFMAIFFMGQTNYLEWPGDTTKNEDFYNSTTVATENTHTIGGSFGNIVGSKTTYIGSGCDRTPNGRIEHHSKSSFGYSYEHSRIKGSGKVIKTGIGISFSPYTINRYNYNNLLTSQDNRADFGIVGYFGRDWKNFGYRLGAWGGNLHLYSGGNAPYGIDKINFMPVLQLRIGELDKFYVMGSVGDDYVYGFYRYIVKASAGGGIKLKSSYIRYEVGIRPGQQFFINTEIPVYGSWSVLPSVFLSDDPIFGIGLRYRDRE